MNRTEIMSDDGGMLEEIAERMKMRKEELLDFKMATRKILAALNCKYLFPSRPYPNYHQVDVIARAMYGDLLKDSGDILLCPVSQNFLTSNPLAQHLVEKEGRYLKNVLMNLAQSKWIGTKHVAFLPCKKLKYRGILFVAVDFYSENRVKINIERIAEALEVAQQFNCKRLSCPENFLYDDYYYITLPFDQLEKVLNKVHFDILDFTIDIVIRKNLKKIFEVCGMIAYYNFENALVERLPMTAEILPWYKNKMKQIRTAYSLSSRTKKKIHKLLISDSVSEKQAYRLFERLYKDLDTYDESGPGRCNIGFEFFLLKFCKEMPWNLYKIRKLLEDFLIEKNLGEFDELTLKEQIGDFWDGNYERCGQNDVKFTENENTGSLYDTVV